MIDTLILSGGGSKMIYYLGLLKFLNEYKLKDDINTFISTSCGSIFSILIILNLSHTDIITIFTNIDLENLLEYNIMKYLENYGLCDTNKIINILSVIIKNKLNIENPYKLTFKEFYKINKKKLKIVCSNITDKKEELFSVDNVPNMNILEAVKLSINIPFFFNKIKYNDKYYVDGGIYNFYPIIHTDNIDKTIGICLMTENNHNNDNFTNYFIDIINIIFNKDINNISTIQKKNTIFINSTMNPIDFNLDNNIFNKITNESYNIIKEFFQTHESFKKLINSS